jgi:hypothetical protein
MSLKNRTVYIQIELCTYKYQLIYDYRPCGVGDRYRHFGGTHNELEDGGSMFIRKCVSVYHTTQRHIMLVSLQNLYLTGYLNQ